MSDSNHEHPSTRAESTEPQEPRVQYPFAMTDAEGGPPARPEIPKLAKHHLEALQASGLNEATIAARGYETVRTKAGLARCGFSDRQQITPTLLVPIRNVRGEISTYQHRPDRPRVVNGKAQKYETPKGSSVVLDVPQASRPFLRDATRPLFITEGSKKADAAAQRGLCTMALAGVWNWRNGGGVLPDWDEVALSGRRVYIVFDSDIAIKKAVTEAMRRLKSLLESRGATVFVTYLPAGEGGIKTGLDDYFARDGGTVDSLLALATDEVRAPVVETNVERESGPIAEVPPYSMTRFATRWTKQLKDGEEMIPLANFGCVIEREIEKSDGAGETSRHVEILVCQGANEWRLRLPQVEFAAGGWVASRLPTGLYVHVGLTIQQHMMIAIRVCSKPERAEVCVHTGWRLVGDEMVFLHAGGAIWPRGSTSQRTVNVELSTALSHSVLPTPPDDETACKDVRAVLRLREVAPRGVGHALLATVLRAVLGPGDVMLWLHGTTGTGKTELAALAQQFFGAGFTAESLPGNWQSTPNAILDLAFEAKDMVAVVDDFVPADHRDPQRAWADAARVVRMVGNRAARGRCGVDGRRRPDRPPRGTLISTSEESPRGASGVARTFIVPLAKGDVRFHVLTELQGLAAGGVFARAMSGYLAWIAHHIADVQARLDDDVAAQRDDLVESLGDGAHARQATSVATLLVGLRLWLDYCEEIGGLEFAERRCLEIEARTELIALAKAQAGLIAREDIGLGFLRFLAEGLASLRYHVGSADADDRLGAPQDPLALGWRHEDTGRDGGTRLVAKGDLVGWRDGDRLYLLPDTAVAAAKAVAQAAGAPLAASKEAILARLDELRLIVEKDGRDDRHRRTVRKTIGGRRNVVAIAVSSILGAGRSSTSHADNTPSATVDHVDQDAGESPSGGRSVAVGDGPLTPEWSTGAPGPWTNTGAVDHNQPPEIVQSAADSGLAGPPGPPPRTEADGEASGVRPADDNLLPPEGEAV